MNTIEKVTFKKAIVDRSAKYSGHRKVYNSHCGRYRIVWRDEAYGVALAPLWFAEVHVEGERFDILSEHRKFETAEEACNRHARSEQ